MIYIKTKFKTLILYLYLQILPNSLSELYSSNFICYICIYCQSVLNVCVIMFRKCITTLKCIRYIMSIAKKKLTIIIVT